MQCSIVVTNDTHGTISENIDSPNYNNNYNSNGTPSQERVLAIFKPAFTGSTKLHRYVQGKAARPWLGLASGQGQLALVSVQRETPIVALEPLSAQEDSPQHPHHRSTLLADIASAGNTISNDQYALSTQSNNN